MRAAGVKSDRLGKYDNHMDIGNISHKNDPKSRMLLILTLVWMAVIFGFSSQNADASMEASGLVSEKLLSLAEMLFGGHPPAFIAEIISQGNYFVRKAGHFIEYLILGCLTTGWAGDIWKRYSFRASLLICVLYAVSDEVHQLFVPGRAGLISDVLLDSAASLVGIAVVAIWRCKVVK